MRVCQFKAATSYTFIYIFIYLHLCTFLNTPMNYVSEKTLRRTKDTTWSVMAKTHTHFLQSENPFLISFIQFALRPPCVAVLA